MHCKRVLKLSQLDTFSIGGNLCDHKVIQVFEVELSLAMKRIYLSHLCLHPF